jgi:hypothetical protein
MAAVAQGVAAGVAAAAEQNRGGSLQAQLVGHPAGAEMAAIAPPAMAAAPAAAELMDPGRQVERHGAWQLTVPLGRGWHGHRQGRNGSRVILAREPEPLTVGRAPDGGPVAAGTSRGSAGSAHIPISRHAL